jgi:16S rRNA (uracil1498-N3)-methyltransferase
VTALRPKVEVVIERLESALPRRREAVVACGAPEGQRADWLVEKLAELGVAVFQPVDTARARWEAGAARLDRWRRLAAAALGQSRRVFLLEILAPTPLEAIEATGGEGNLWLCDHDGTPSGSVAAGAGRTTAVVGPAQGLAAGERTWLEARGFRPMRLSDGRLRAETAALAWAAWWAGAGPSAAGEGLGPGA